MFRLTSLLTFAAIILHAASGSAHFIWIATQPQNDGTCRIQLYFAEVPEPSEARLLSKVQKTKLWLRAAGGAERAIPFVTTGEPSAAALTAVAKQSDQPLVEATCDYGVYQHGPTAMLLQYYAKHLPDDWVTETEQHYRSPRMTLDVSPKLDRGSLVISAYYQDKPAADAQIVVLGPNSLRRELKTDASGQVRLEKPASGPYAVRAGYILKGATGARDGKSYSETAHYCTATFALNPTGSAKPALTAAELLQRARDARSIWKDFPGFAADLTLSDGQGSFSGKMEIDSSGTVSLAVAKSSAADWAEEELTSLVQHRMPDGEIKERNVQYADHDTTHPLGRKITLGDVEHESAYRIKDDVILEVNRSMGRERFTISVLEIERNAENKYLPRSFSMNFFDSASGKLLSSRTYWNQWQRVGGFDIPKSILETATEHGTVVTRRMDFANVHLLKPRS